MCSVRGLENPQAVLKEMEESGQTPMSFSQSSRKLQELLVETWGITGWVDELVKAISEVSN